MRLFLFVLFIASYTHVWGCTAFQIQSQDGAHIYCRTMEYSFPLSSDLLIVGKNTPFTATTASGAPGMKWTSKYGYVGMNQEIAPKLVSDGMNEKGLVVGALYLLGFAHYQTPDPEMNDRTLGPWELSSYLLGSCATIDEVKEKVQKVLVAHEPVPFIKDFVLPLHFYVCDQSGRVLVIEYLAGKLHLIDNPIAVLTNAPPLEWHILNLANYVNLSPVNVTKLNLKDLEVHNHGQGSGLLGMPGDYTPPSRFIRVAFFSQCAKPAKEAKNTALLGFHILNTFDIFDGIVRSKDGTEPQYPDVTEWAIVHDRTNLVTYFRSYESLQIQMVDLTKLPLEKPGFSKIELKKSFDVCDESQMLKPL